MTKRNMYKGMAGFHHDAQTEHWKSIRKIASLGRVSEATTAMASRTIALVTGMYHQRHRSNSLLSGEGGNNGIGYEAVKALLQSTKPYHVLMGSRSREKATTAIEKLQKECPDSKNTVEAVQVDLTSDDSIHVAFEQVKASPGRIDTLVNNAG